MTKAEMRELAKMVAKEIMTLNAQQGAVNDEYLTTKEAADLLKISEQTLYNNKDKYPYHKKGKRLIFSRNALIRVMNE